MTMGILIDPGKSLSSVVGTIVSIDLDATIREVHEWRNDVTSSPVEEGAPVADHILILPDKLSLSGTISDAPISKEIGSRFSGGIDSTADPQRAQTAFDFLYILKRRRELVTVYTRYKIYEDMAITSIDIPRDANVGEAVDFTMQFEQVRIVSTQTVDVPPGISKKGSTTGDIKKSASPTKNAGAKQNNQKQISEDRSVGSSITGTSIDKIKDVANNISKSASGFFGIGK